MPEFALVITSGNRIVPTIHKHIVSSGTLPGGEIRIRADKPADLRVIIAALAVVKSGLAVVIVAAIAKGIDLRHGTGSADDLAPGVINIFGLARSAAVKDTDYIALKVGDIVVHGRRRRGAGFIGERIGLAALIIEEFQNFTAVCLGNEFAPLPDILVLYAVDSLARS